MNHRLKYQIALVLLVAGVVCAFIGFSRVQGDALTGHIRTSSFVLLFGGAITGVTAEVCRRYWRGMVDRDDSQKIALDVLAEVGRQELEKRKTKKNN